MRRELVDTKREREAAEADYERMGWEVNRSAGRSVAERGFRGSWVWHILYFLIAPVYGNLIYSAYRRYDRPEQIVIRTRGGAEPDATRDADGDTVDDRDAARADPVDDTDG